MPIEIIVPAVGESIREATISKWFKITGDAVALDEPLFEIETDKITTEVNSPQAGTLGDILRRSGELVKIGELVAYLLEAVVPIVPSPTKTNAEMPTVLTPVLSPTARGALRETGVALSAVTGTGPGGRITKQDLENYMAAQGARTMAQQAPAPASEAAPVAPPPSSPAPAPASAPLAARAEAPRTRVEPMTTMRRKIAEHMVISKHTAAHVTTVHKVDMTKVAKMRERNKAIFQDRYGFSLTYLSFIARAATVALRQYPVINASIQDTDRKSVV